MRVICSSILVCGFLVLSSVMSLRLLADEQPKPDFIVSELKRVGDEIVIEVQNQGPGSAKDGELDATVNATLSSRMVVVDPQTGKALIDPSTKLEKFENKTRRETTEFKVPVPTAPFATKTVRLPVKKIGILSDEWSAILEVNLDVSQAVSEEREHNNTYYKQLQTVGQIDPERGNYKSNADLPDLVITDIVRQGKSLVTKYENRGKGTTGADFAITLNSETFHSGGNHFYRIQVPAPGARNQTGGYSHNNGTFGLETSGEIEVVATIDHEDRVRESDKTNNTFKKKFRIEIPGSPSTPKGQPEKIQWEYKVIQINKALEGLKEVDEQVVALEKTLNNLGREGWEFCHVHNGLYTFKRVRDAAK